MESLKFQPKDTLRKTPNTCSVDSVRWIKKKIREKICCRIVYEVCKLCLMVKLFWVISPSSQLFNVQIFIGSKSWEMFFVLIYEQMIFISTSIRSPENKWKIHFDTRKGKLYNVPIHFFFQTSFYEESKICCGKNIKKGRFSVQKEKIILYDALQYPTRRVVCKNGNTWIRMAEILNIVKLIETLHFFMSISYQVKCIFNLVKPVQIMQILQPKKGLV